jgi:hypothetical protein
VGLPAADPAQLPSVHRRPSGRDATGAGATILYAILLAFTGLVFWSPGSLFTWVFNGVFQMARYPVGLYPG